MRSFPLTRRHAIANGIALAAASHASPVGATDSPLDDALRALLPHRDSAAAIGRTWLTETPGKQADRTFLVRALGSYSTTASLRRRIREDFSAGRVVSVDGWILSLTEAQGCALVALDMSPIQAG